MKRAIAYCNVLKTYEQCSSSLTTTLAFCPLYENYIFVHSMCLFRIVIYFESIIWYYLWF